MSDNPAPEEVRCVLLPIYSGQLLLPSASIAEVVGYRPPNPIENADLPDWVMGTFSWRRRQIPLISFDAMVSFASSHVGHRARIAICYALGGDEKIQYVALMLRAIPRLIRIDEETIEVAGEIGDVGPMVLSQVRINGEEAWIPNLEALEEAVREYFHR